MRKIHGMLKYFSIAAMVILLLLFGFWGFLKYQDHVSYENAIHGDAGLIIKIDRNQLIRKIGLNTLSNPGYYFKADEKDSLEIDDKEGRDNGFDTRANVFIFSLNEEPLTFYTNFEVTDSAALKTFLDDKFGMRSFEDSESSSIGMSSDKRLLAAFTRRRLVLSYAVEKRHNLKIIGQILQKKGMLNTDDSRISRFKDFKDDVVFLNNEVAGSLNFNDGVVNLSASLNKMGGYSISDQSRVAAVDTLCSIHLALAGNFLPDHFKPFTVNDIRIPLDSIMGTYQGYLEFKMAGKVTQADTIVTYEYDDNFEKIEVKTLQEKEVPGLSLMMKANAAEMQQLLSYRNIVKENEINRDIFPLMKLNFKTEENTVRISNNEIKHLSPISDSDNVFFLFSDFSKLRSESGIPIPEELLKDLRKLEIYGSRVGDKIKVEGKLVLDNKDINALMQLMD